MPFTILYKQEELLYHVQKKVDDYVKRYAERYSEKEIRKNFGVYSAIRFSTGGKTTANRFINFFKKGIETALSIEQLTEYGFGLGIHYPSRFTGEKIKFCYPKSTTELIDVAKKIEEFFRTLSDRDYEDTYLQTDFNDEPKRVMKMLGLIQKRMLRKK